MHAETPQAPGTPSEAAHQGAGLRRFGDFVFDPGAGRLLKSGQPVALQPRYFAVLGLLLERAGRLVSKDELLDAVWGHRHVSESALRVAIHAVRDALDDESRAQRWLQTLPRRGYRLDLPDTAAAQAAQAAPPSDAALPGNLPRPVGVLIGRDAELHDIGQRLRDGVLLTLHGPSGVGKTRLALAAAALEPPPLGVWLLRLDTLSDAAPLLATLAELLGLPAGSAASAQALARALAPLRLRLLLDNAEHLVDAVAELAEAIYAAAPGVQLLVTSQRPLQLASEQLLPVAPLALPGAGLAQDAAAPAASLQLLLARIAQALPGFAPDARGLTQAAAICHALDGLPLALELAAARVPTLGLAGVQARLHERLALLTRGPRDAPDRHRTLRAALEWSVALLAPPQRELLAGLSVFPGSFAASAAQAVLADLACDAEAVLDALESLREHALLHVQAEHSAAGEPQLRLLDSVRVLAAERLAASGRAQAVADAHLHWVLGRFRAADDEFLAEPVLPWLTRTRPLVEDLRQAMQHALAQPRLHDVALALFVASLRFRLRGGWRREAMADYTRLKSAAEKKGAHDGPRDELDAAMATLGGMSLLWPVDEALAAAERSTERYLERGDARRAYLTMSYSLVMLMRQQAPLAQRQALSLRMRALEQPDWPPALFRHGVWQQALLLRAAGDLDAYLQRSRDVMAASRACGDLNMAWVAAQAMAQMHTVRGELDAAHELMGRTVAEMRACGHLRSESTALALAATVAAVRSGDEGTRTLLREAVTQLAAEDMLWWMADALAWLPLHQGRWRDAARVQSWADALVQARGDTRGVMFATLRERLMAALQARPEAPALLELMARQPACAEAEAIALALADPD